ncbi:MAG: hypothetical protein RLZ25_303 [Pseudomonadota bacterium]
MMKKKTALLLPLGLMMSGCSGVPTGPSVLVLPGAHQDFSRFTRDDGFCRQYALAQVAGATPQASAVETGAGAAVVGTAVGAASGAAIGGGYGAAVGAGAGLIGGSAIGTGMGYQAGYAAQQRYDHAYIQCMYGHGHQVPVQGVIARPSSQTPREITGASETNGIPLPPSNTGIPLPPSKTNTNGRQENLPLPPR